MRTMSRQVRLKSAARPTIRDVAREAGVGTTTVSRVINGGQLVAPAIRERVESVIRELNYQPSHAARSLKQERSRSIGLIVPRLTDSFYAGIASIAQAVCRANGYILMISTSQDMEEQALEELRVFERQRVDGVILIPPMTQSAEFQAFVKPMQERMVSVDLPVEGVRVSSVQTDNVEAMSQATRHLLDHGRKRILLLISDPELQTMRERRRGYETVMKKAGLKSVVQEGIHTLEEMEAALLESLDGKQPIDGLLTANNPLGMLALQALQKHQVSGPETVAMITFDDFALADLLRPAVTAVAQPVEELGRSAATLLLSMLEKPGHAEKSLRVPSELVVRQSCGCP